MVGEYPLPNAKRVTSNGIPSWPEDTRRVHDLECLPILQLSSTFLGKIHVCYVSPPVEPSRKMSEFRLKIQKKHSMFLVYSNSSFLVDIFFYMFLPDAPAKQSECHAKTHDIPLQYWSAQWFLIARLVGDGAGPANKIFWSICFFSFLSLPFRLQVAPPVTPVTSLLFLRMGFFDPKKSAVDVDSNREEPLEFHSPSYHGISQVSCSM